MVLQGEDSFLKNVPNCFWIIDISTAEGEGRGNSGMYGHSLLPTWHGMRNNVFQLSERLPEQSTYSTRTLQLYRWSWKGCVYLLKHLSQVVVWQNRHWISLMPVILRKEVILKKQQNLNSAELDTFCSFHFWEFNFWFWIWLVTVSESWHIPLSYTPGHLEHGREKMSQEHHHCSYPSYPWNGWVITAERVSLILRKKNSHCCQTPKPSIQMFVSPFPSETETVWFYPNSS